MAKKRGRSSGRGASASRARGVRGDVQARRLASDIQARGALGIRRIGDVQFLARAGDVQRAAMSRQRHFRPRAGDVQRFKLPDDLRNILVERHESIARAYEAEAELALARGTLARLEARLAEMGYFVKE